MMLVVSGLPAHFKYHDAKAMIKQEAHITDFILDNLVVDGDRGDGIKKVTVALADSNDVAVLMRRLTGFDILGNKLKVTAIGKNNVPLPPPWHKEKQQTEFGQPQNKGKGFTQKPELPRGFNQQAEKPKMLTQPRETPRGFIQQPQLHRGLTQQTVTTSGFQQIPQGFNQQSELSRRFNQQGENLQGFDQQTEPPRAYQQSMGQTDHTKYGYGLSHGLNQPQGFQAPMLRVQVEDRPFGQWQFDPNSRPGFSGPSSTGFDPHGLSIGVRLKEEVSKPPVFNRLGPQFGKTYEDQTPAHPFSAVPSAAGPLKPPANRDFLGKPSRFSPLRQQSPTRRSSPNRHSPQRRTSRQMGSRSSPPHQGPLRRSPPRQNTFKRSPPRQGQSKGSPPRQGMPRRSPQRQEFFSRRSPPRNGAPRRSSPRGGVSRRSPPHDRRRSPLRQGPFRGSPPRHGQFKVSPPRPGAHERPIRGSPPLQGQPRGSTVHQGSLRVSPPRQGRLRGSPPRHGQFRGSPPRQAPFRGSPSRLEQVEPVGGPGVHKLGPPRARPPFAASLAQPSENYPIAPYPAGEDAYIPPSPWVGPGPQNDLESLHNRAPPFEEFRREPSPENYGGAEDRQRHDESLREFRGGEQRHEERPGRLRSPVFGRSTGRARSRSPLGSRGAPSWRPTGRSPGRRPDRRSTPPRSSQRRSRTPPRDRNRRHDSPPPSWGERRGRSPSPGHPSWEESRELARNIHVPPSDRRSPPRGPLNPYRDDKMPPQTRPSRFSDRSPLRPEPPMPHFENTGPYHLQDHPTEEVHFHAREGTWYPEGHPPHDEGRQSPSYERNEAWFRDNENDGMGPQSSEHIRHDPSSSQRSSENKRTEQPHQPYNQGNVSMEVATLISKQIVGYFNPEPAHDERFQKRLIVSMKKKIADRIDDIFGETIGIPFDDILRGYRDVFPEDDDEKLLHHCVQGCIPENIKEKMRMAEGGPSHAGKRRASPPLARPRSPPRHGPPAPAPPPSKKTKPPVPYLEKILPGVVARAVRPIKPGPGPGSFVPLPKHPETDKKIRCEQRILQKLEYAEQSLYHLEETQRRAVDSELDTIVSIMIGQLPQTPQGLADTEVVKAIRGSAGDAIRHVLDLHLTKRLLGIGTSLSVRVYATPRMPSKPSIEAFLREYRAVAMKKSALSNARMFIVTLPDYFQFDRICQLGTVVLEGNTIRIKPLQLTGPKAAKMERFLKKLDRSGTKQTPASVSTFTISQQTMQQPLTSVGSKPSRAAGKSSQTGNKKSAPKPLPTAPKPLQSAPKPLQSAPKPLQPAPKPSQSAPKPLQSAPKPSQSAPKPLQSAPKPSESAPNASQSAPKPPQSAPNASQSAPKPPQSASNPSESAPKPSQSGAKSSQSAGNFAQPVRKSSSHNNAGYSSRDSQFGKRFVLDEVGPSDDEYGYIPFDDLEDY